jgi:hypothetical protein
MFGGGLADLEPTAEVVDRAADVAFVAFALLLLAGLVLLWRSRGAGAR